jgi:hypothetical protein
MARERLAALYVADRTVTLGRMPLDPSLVTAALRLLDNWRQHERVNRSRSRSRVGHKQNAPSSVASSASSSLAAPTGPGVVSVAASAGPRRLRVPHLPVLDRFRNNAIPRTSQTTCSGRQPAAADGGRPGRLERLHDPFGIDVATQILELIGADGGNRRQRVSKTPPPAPIAVRVVASRAGSAGRRVTAGPPAGSR